MRSPLRVLFAFSLLALLVPAAASAYGWPIRPFYQQHAIRGYFNDPRLSGPEQGFHFGVDISAADGTPVYAIEPGTARVHGQTVSIFPKRGGHRLSYWHVVPAVAKGQRVRRHQLIGRIVAGAGHVHLAEYKDGTYINPLRLGGLAPYIDDTVPQIPSLTFLSSGHPIPPEAVSGAVDIATEAFDTSPMPIAFPWNQAIFTPALIRWRIVQGQNTIKPWETPVDFRTFLLPISLYDFIYTPGTFQNKAGRRGRYDFYVAHQFDTRVLPNGSYVLQVEARDEQENVGQALFAFTVRN
ncbi:MAG TPA: M23 family metallopeptidase [Gaiellaceae bacterium]|nr:M23 family metallopeptidase [Gaiellaceae bacterium]